MKKAPRIDESIHLGGMLNLLNIIGIDKELPMECKKLDKRAEPLPSQLVTNKTFPPKGVTLLFTNVT